MIFSPELEIFNYFYKYSAGRGYDTYDYLPTEEENVPYPFVIIGDTSLTPDSTKNSLDGDLQLDIDLWNEASNRAAISNMMNDFLHQALKIEGTDNYTLVLNKQRTETRLITDYSVENQVLLHGIMNLHFEIL